MPKRSSSDSDSDDGESLYAPASPKRARTSEADNEENMEDDDEIQRGINGQKNPEGGEENGEAEDQKFEEQHGKKIMADLVSKRKTHGGIAEHGIIERIELLNFMCHKYLTFEFGPQINFIIGHNGSGKSAVLSGITVALGGKSNSTGRGSGLKAFIKEGCNVAEVTISLKNQGEEAYKPNEYGKSIIVTRRFTREGSSSWKIRGTRSQQIISTKREELSSICDHMNIQVDNPLNVLTQDSARQFLSASHPSDKYKFFLRGTQLSQLSEEYDTCYANIKQTFKILAQKKEALPDLRAAFRDATTRFEEAAKAREQKHKADELKKELAWAHVRGKEEEMEAKIQEVAKLESRLPKIEKSIDEATAKFNTANEEIARHEAEIQAAGDLDDLSQEKDILQGLIRANRDKIGTFAGDMKGMQESIKMIDNQMSELDKQIEAERQRMAANTKAKHDETQQRLEEARQAVSDTQTRYDTLTAQLREQQEKNDRIKQYGEGVETEIKTLKGEIQNCQAMIQRVKDAEKNSLIPYGNNIKAVLDAVKTMRWYGEPPLGPLGMHVKARDAKTWGHLLRSQLGGLLTAFVITDARDRGGLKGLLEKSGNPRTLIIISERDIFDYSSGEPPEDYLTVLRALDISDPFVLRVLINSARIERQVLAHKRFEGQQMLQALHGGGSAWTNDGFSVRVFPEGGCAMTPLGENRGHNDATSLLLTGRDSASEIGYHQAQLRTHEESYNAAQKRLNDLKAEFAVGRRTLDALKSQHAEANNQLRRAKTHLASVQQEVNEVMPTNVASFESAKQDAEEEKAHVLEQLKDVLRQKQEVDDRNKELIPQLEKIKARMAEFNEYKSGIASKMGDATERKMQAQQSRDHYMKKLNAEKDVIKDAKAVADVLQQEFTNWTNKALEYCERVENPRSAEVVKRHLDSVQQALQARKKRNEASVEEMTIEVNKSRARLETAEKDLRQMTHLNKSLKESLVVRLQRWQEFRRHIALRCKFVFAYHLSHRGYYGKVLFNHEAGTLVLKVQTDDQAATQATREKDPRSLSGGEKSFSTICLLLSLWESIGCPLRCLDEFDVFMDAINRRISMKMMIDMANSSDKKQYILITPQDMGNVQIGATVKVNRMTDPERNQPN